MPAAGPYNTPPQTTLNITSATVVKIGSGMLLGLSVTVAGAAGTINDCVTTGAASAANTMVASPAAVEVVQCNIPFYNGLVVAPGAGQTVVVTWQ